MLGLPLQRVLDNQKQQDSGGDRSSFFAEELRAIRDKQNQMDSRIVSYTMFSSSVFLSSENVAITCTISSYAYLQGDFTILKFKMG